MEVGEKNMSNFTRTSWIGFLNFTEVFRAFFRCSVSVSVVTKALDVETETKTEAVYLETEAEAQGSCPILFP